MSRTANSTYNISVDCHHSIHCGPCFKYTRIILISGHAKGSRSKSHLRLYHMPGGIRISGSVSDQITGDRRLFPLIRWKISDE